MKKIYLCIFSLIPFMSCDELDENFNYIEVTATGDVLVCRLSAENGDTFLNLDETIAGEPVEMALVKAGGERVEDTGTSGSNGTTSITGYFNLYKEQPIEFSARLANYPEQYGSTKLTWEYADQHALNHDNGARTLTHSFYIILGVPDSN